MKDLLIVVIFLFPEDNQDHHSVLLVEFFLQQCSKTHPHHSLLYIFLLLFYMIFPYLSMPLIIGSIQFFLKFIYNELFPHIPIFRFHIQFVFKPFCIEKVFFNLIKRLH
ncbi:hypothetical protein COK42_11920 [Bacillus cereus]|nr:hypothetical protein COK42_11920 [Bacillus cereus]